MIKSILLLIVVSAMAFANEGQELEFCDLNGLNPPPGQSKSDLSGRDDQGPPAVPNPEEAIEGPAANGGPEPDKLEGEIQKPGQSENVRIDRERRGRGKQFPLPDNRERRPTGSHELGGKDTRVLTHGDDGRRRDRNQGGSVRGDNRGGVRGGRVKGGRVKGGRKGGKRENTGSKQIEADEPALAEGGFESGRKKN